MFFSCIFATIVHIQPYINRIFYFPQRSETFVQRGWTKSYLLTFVSVAYGYCRLDFNDDIWKNRQD